MVLVKASMAQSVVMAMELKTMATPSKIGPEQMHRGRRRRATLSAYLQVRPEARTR
jgi:hypothetical protein